MFGTWSGTAINFSPGTHRMADTDREALSFTIGQNITAASSATLHRYDTLASVPTSIESVVVQGQDVVVTVSGLTRGTTYELSVTFVRTDLTRVTRTLTIECVA